MVQPLEKFPFKLLLLAKAADDEVCSTRQKVAAEILGTQTHMLEINARKMKSTFESDLTVAMNQGLLVGHLRVSIRGLAQRWQADTRESERVNKTLTLLSERCPTISDELKSCRACLKHFLGQAGSPGAPELRRKWSQYKPVASRLMDLCLASWPERLDVQEDCSRWSPPAIPTDLPNDKELSKIHDKLNVNPRQTMSRKWAACCNMILNKKLKTIRDAESGVPIINFSQRAPDGSGPLSLAFYVAADKVWTSRRFVKCCLRGESELWLEEPLKFFNSVDVIDSYWSAVQSGCNVGVVHIQTDLVAQSESERRFKLPFIGTRKAANWIMTLNPPTKKVRKKLQKCDLDSDENEDSDDGQEHDEVEVDDNDNSAASETDDAFESGLASLMEELEELEAEHGLGRGDGDGDDENEATTARRAIKQVLQETDPLEPDELELTKKAEELEAAEEIEPFVGENGRKRKPL